MREILFRGKRIDTGEWIEGSAINTQYDVRGYKHTYIGIFVISERYPLMKTIEWYEVIPETVGQFTGLYDSTKWEDLSTEEQAEFLYPTNGGKRKKEDWKGKPIFEGDICKHRSNYSGDFIISIVTYTDGQFLSMADNNSGFNLSDKLEVIGNIHDNPELLGGGEK